MTNPDLEKLKALAERATPGPWHRGRALEPTLWTKDMKTRIACDTEQDAEYIAAVSPDVVLGLIGEVERLSEEREGVQKNYENLHHDFAEIGKSLVELCSLRAENEKLKAHYMRDLCESTMVPASELRRVRAQLAEARELVRIVNWTEWAQIVSIARAYLEKYPEKK